MDSKDRINLTSFSKKEKRSTYRGLDCLVLALHGKEVLIDLRNDSSVIGKLTLLDGYMDIIMDDAIFINPRGEKFYFDSFFIRNRSIRYIHIPEGVSITEAITDQLKFMYGLNARSQKGSVNYKSVRAQRNQRETLASLNN